MKKENLEKIIKVVSDTIGVQEKKIGINSKATDFFKWDSLGQITIMVKIGKMLKKKIPTSKISELNSVKKIFDYVSKNQ